MVDVAWDAVVIGAGTAGLMAAIAGGRARPADAGAGEEPQTGRQNPHVRWHPLQPHARHRQPGHRRRGYGQAGRFLHSALAAFSVGETTIDFFEAEGVATKVEETGKVFPVSNKAADVWQAIVAATGTQRCHAGV